MPTSPLKTTSRTIPSDPRAWTIADADAAIDSGFEAVGGPDGYRANESYLAGNHGQDGKRWMGIGLENGSLDATIWKNQISPRFVPVPEVEKCVWRRTSAACANEPDFTLTPSLPAGAADSDGRKQPSDQQQRVSGEWADDLGAWWSQRRAVSVWDAVKRAVRNASGSGQACVRLFFNQRFVSDVGEDGNGRRRTGIPTQPDRRTALRVIECSSPLPSACAVYHDPDTLQPVGVYRYSTAERMRAMELWFVDSEATVLRISVEGEDPQEWRFQWGGLLPIVPISVEPLLTPAVRLMQAAADTTATGALNLALSHSYTQRDEIDAIPPGIFKTDPPPGVDSPYTIVRDGVTLYLWPALRELGNSVVTNLYGHETTRKVTDEGSKVSEEREYHSPRVEYHEPSDPEHVLKIKREYQRDIREACHQGHILGDSSAEASGDAYEQRRAEFIADVNGVASATASLVSGILAAATVMADELSAGGSPARFARDWIVSTRIQADPGPPSTEKLRITGELVEKEVISVVEGRVRAGVQDTQLEAERIASQTHAAGVLARAQAAKGMIDAGVSPQLAWLEVGYPPEKAEMFARNDFISEDE